MILRSDVMAWAVFQDKVQHLDNASSPLATHGFLKLTLKRSFAVSEW